MDHDALTSELIAWLTRDVARIIDALDRRPAHDEAPPGGHRQHAYTIEAEGAQVALLRLDGPQGASQRLVLSAGAEALSRADLNAVVEAHAYALARARALIRQIEGPASAEGALPPGAQVMQLLQHGDLQRPQQALKSLVQRIASEAARVLLVELSEVDRDRFAEINPSAAGTLTHISRVQARLRRRLALDDARPPRLTCAREPGEEPMELIRDPQAWLALILLGAMSAMVWRARRGEPMTGRASAPEAQPEQRAPTRAPGAPGVARAHLIAWSHHVRERMDWRAAGEALTEDVAEFIIDEWNALGVLDEAALAAFLGDDEVVDYTPGETFGGDAESFLVAIVRDGAGRLQLSADGLRSDDEDALLELARGGDGHVTLVVASLDALTRFGFRFR